MLEDFLEAVRFLVSGRLRDVRNDSHAATNRSMDRWSSCFIKSFESWFQEQGVLKRQCAVFVDPMRELISKLSRSAFLRRLCATAPGAQAEQLVAATLPPW
jgi:hypothetical protein